MQALWHIGSARYCLNFIENKHAKSGHQDWKYLSLECVWTILIDTLELSCTERRQD
jgi:hypothetical protein